MAENLKIIIRPPEKGTLSRCWGEFTHRPCMPWQSWELTSEPETLFKVGDVEVLKCFADEYLIDEQGLAHLCPYQFLVGRRMDGEAIWWYNLDQEYDSEIKIFVKTSITFKGKQVIVKGYGGSGPDKGKTVCIDVETGVKSVI